MRRALFAIWYIPLFAILTIAAGFAALALNYFSKRAVRRISSQGWAHIVLDPALIKVSATGRENLPPPESGGFIIFANHRSLLDIPTVAEATGRSITWVAKAALGRIPVFGWALKRVHLLVDRGGSAEAAKAMIADAAKRISQGEIIAIFPEGTRNKTGDPLLPFKKGAFILAKHTGAPLVPLAILNSGELWPSGRLCPKPGLIKVAIGPPLSVRPDEPLSKISLKARQVLQDLYLSLEAGAASSGQAGPEAPPEPAREASPEGSLEAPPEGSPEGPPEASQGESQEGSPGRAMAFPEPLP